MKAGAFMAELSYQPRPVWQWVWFVPRGFVRRFRIYRDGSLAWRLFVAAYLGTRRMKIDGRDV